jgi:hypothetical protein
MVNRLIANAAEAVGIFARSEDGNVTIDWTVLLGGLVGLSLAVMALIGGSVVAFSDRAEVELGSREVAQY